MKRILGRVWCPIAGRAAGCGVGLQCLAAPVAGMDTLEVLWAMQTMRHNGGELFRKGRDNEISLLKLEGFWFLS